MTQEQLTAFLAQVKGNTNLQEQLKTATDVDAVAEIAKGAGFYLFSDDFANAQPELSEEDLEYVAGGGAGGIASIIKLASYLVKGRACFGYDKPRK